MPIFEKSPTLGKMGHTNSHFGKTLVLKQNHALGNTLNECYNRDSIEVEGRTKYEGE